MDFALTSDQHFLQDSARAFLADAAGPDALRAAVAGPTGFDRALWDRLAGEMGYAGLMVPEAFGGAGLGAVEMALVLEETGRTLAAVPFFETAVLAVQGLLAAGSPAQQAELLQKLAAGTCKASFCGTADRPALANRRLQGTATYVTFAHVADLLIVATVDNSLLALKLPMEGVAIDPLPTLDRTRRFAHVTFDCLVPDESMLGVQGGAASAIRRVLDIGAGLLASEQDGRGAILPRLHGRIQQAARAVRPRDRIVPGL